MTDIDTAAIEARLAAATAGPEQWAPIPGTEWAAQQSSGVKVHCGRNLLAALDGER